MCAHQNFRRHLLAAGAALLLLGCESTGNIDKGYDPAAAADAGVAIFTVTHERGEGMKSGANLKFFVNLRDVDRATPQPRSFSNMETLSPLMSSEIEGAWGRVYVRRLPAGHYEFIDWELEHNTGVGARSLTPRTRAAALAFEIKPSQVVYLGRIHARVLWGSNVFGVPLAAGAVPEVRDHFASDVALATRNFPQLQGKVTPALLPQGVWFAD